MSTKEKPFRAEGRSVFKNPVSTGKGTMSMGFLLCEVSEWVDDTAAHLIATALNEVDGKLTLQDQLSGARGVHKLLKREIDDLKAELAKAKGTKS